MSATSASDTPALCWNDKMELKQHLVGPLEKPAVLILTAKLCREFILEIAAHEEPLWFLSNDKLQGRRKRLKGCVGHLTEESGERHLALIAYDCALDKIVARIIDEDRERLWESGRLITCHEQL